MWRIWTRGWGLRGWWRWFWNEELPMRVAWMIPRRVALWVFVRVYGCDLQAPGPEYVRVYKAWQSGAGR